MAYQNWNQLLWSSTATGGAIVGASATDVYPAMDYTFPANFFQIGTAFRIEAIGIMTSGTGSTSTWSVQLGSTTINAAFGAITLVNTQTNQKFKVVIDCEARAIGATTVTTFLCQGVFQCSPALLAATTQFLPTSGAAALGTGVDVGATQQLKLMHTFATPGSLTIEQMRIYGLN